ncbi:MAG: S1 RNA-binding domain-containing protein, partial [Chitinophagaceae bacterium]
NITNFGAFVDIGVKQDGLVHISQLSNTFISDPNQVVKLQQQVMVTVTEVDVSRKRIALTMKGHGQKEQGTRDKVQARDKEQGARAQGSKDKIVKKAEPQNAFQAKLMELKKKFND